MVLTGKMSRIGLLSESKMVGPGGILSGLKEPPQNFGPGKSHVNSLEERSRSPLKTAGLAILV